MIILDSSVWIDYFHRPDAEIESHLLEQRVLMHPVVLGELACGRLRNREETLETLRRMPLAVEASHRETMRLIEERRLWSEGLGYSDAQLLAAARLTHATIITRDRALRRAAERLGVAA